MKSESVVIQVKGTGQYFFPVVLFITLYKVASVANWSELEVHFWTYLSISNSSCSLESSPAETTPLIPLRTEVSA